MPVIFHLSVLIGSIAMLVWLSRGPFFVPTRRKYVPRIIQMLEVKVGEKIADLGSGDGRLLFAIAEAGAIAYGFEHNPLLVWRSRRNAQKRGLEGKVVVFQSNFWNADISAYDGIVIYGIPYIMERLEAKLRKELRSGARVVSYSFPFPNWAPDTSDKHVFLYRQP